MQIKKYITISFLVLLAFPAPAYSQPNIEKAVKEADRPIREESEEKLKPPPEKKPEIKEEEGEKEKPEGPKFFIKKVVLVGCESFPAEEFKPIVEQYENKELTFADLDVLAREIEREYLARGIISASFVPPQEIKENVIMLQVVEAKMGALEVQGHRFFSKKRIPFYWAIKPGEVLRYDKISRSLQHMNKNPDRVAKAALHAGKKPGTTDVLLDVETHFPIHSVFSFDREGSTYSGINRTGFGIKHNNALGLDDTLLTGTSYGSNFYGRYIYHIVPVTGFGTSFLYGFSHSVARPKKDYEVFELKSTADNSSFFIYQDLFRKDEYTGEVHLGLDAKDKTVRLRNRTSNRDSLRILKVGGNFLIRGNKNVTQVSPEFSRGVDFFGAKQKNPYPSRGAENTFSKYNLDIKHKRNLVWGLQTSLNFKGQLAGEKLMPQEEFSLGGMDSVRGYPSGDYLADIALQTNAELLIPAFFIPEKIKIPLAANPLKEDITGVMFFDYGYGQRRGIVDGEKGRKHLAGIGLGVRINLFKQGLLRLEWGLPVSGHEPGSGSTAGRFHISINFEDRIFDEAERIGNIMKQRRLERKKRKELETKRN